LSFYQYIIIMAAIGGGGGGGRDGGCDGGESAPVSLQRGLRGYRS
jgi:hypothetical protein